MALVFTISSTFVYFPSQAVNPWITRDVVDARQDVDLNNIRAIKTKMANENGQVNIEIKEVELEDLPKEISKFQSNNESGFEDPQYQTMNVTAGKLKNTTKIKFKNTLNRVKEKILSLCFGNNIPANCKDTIKLATLRGTLVGSGAFALLLFEPHVAAMTLGYKLGTAAALFAITGGYNFWRLTRNHSITDDINSAHNFYGIPPAVNRTMKFLIKYSLPYNFVIAFLPIFIAAQVLNVNVPIVDNSLIAIGILNGTFLSLLQRAWEHGATQYFKNTVTQNNDNPHYNYNPVIKFYNNNMFWSSVIGSLLTVAAHAKLEYATLGIVAYTGVALAVMQWENHYVQKISKYIASHFRRFTQSARCEALFQ